MSRLFPAARGVTESARATRRDLHTTIRELLTRAGAHRTPDVGRTLSLRRSVHLDSRVTIGASDANASSGTEPVVVGDVSAITSANRIRREGRGGASGCSPLLGV
jgi:hypothetical protein